MNDNDMYLHSTVHVISVNAIPVNKDDVKVLTPNHQSSRNPNPIITLTLNLTPILTLTITLTLDLGHRS